MSPKALGVKKILSENIGISMGKAMLKAGYSPSTAETPQRLTQTKAWKEVFNEAIPDALLNAKLMEGLDSNRTISSLTGSKATGVTMDFIDVPDMAVRHKYLETAYKLKGRLKDSTQLEGVLEVRVSRG